MVNDFIFCVELPKSCDELGEEEEQEEEEEERKRRKDID
jgi:hypothetical protein